LNDRNKIKVLIVDDSSYMRYVLKNILKDDAGIEVVGEARDGVDALKKFGDVNPDVVTLDVEMPRMDGLTTLKKLMAIKPVPVLMVSRYTESGGEITIEALQSGAIDFVQKPEGRDALTMNKVKDELISKIKIAAAVTKSKLFSADMPVRTHAAATDKKWKTAAGRLRKVAVICSSTGGPRALAEVMSRIPADAPICILIVQHMPPGFTESLAHRLDQISAFQVGEAKEGDVIMPGKAFVAPGDYHLRIKQTGNLYLVKEAHVNNVRPAADVTLSDAALVFGKNTICVILTGMGNDGTAGGTAVKENGGATIAQHGATCTVNGMPASLINAGMADIIAPLDRIAAEIISLV